MTQEEFSKTGWGANMKCTYKGAEYNIVSVNFQEKLVALECGEDDEIWVRCENIEFVQ